MFYTIWRNYGLEGWKPDDYETKEELLEAILSGKVTTQEFRITRALTLDVTEIKEW